MGGGGGVHSALPRARLLGCGLRERRWGDRNPSWVGPRNGGWGWTRGMPAAWKGKVPPASGWGRRGVLIYNSRAEYFSLDLALLFISGGLLVTADILGTSKTRHEAPAAEWDSGG